MLAVITENLMYGRGMHIVGIASPFYKCDMPGLDDVEGPGGPLHSATARGLGGQIALLEHCIEIARFFDTNLAAVLPGAVEPEWTLVGGGQIDYPGQMAALRADGYPKNWFKEKRTTMSLNSFRHGLGRVTSTIVGKSIIFVIGALLVFSFVYSGLPGNSLGGAASAAQGETIATANGAEITRGDFDTELETVIQSQLQGQQPGPLESAVVHDAVLEHLIEAKLQLQTARKMGLTASDDEIAKQRQQIIVQSGIIQRMGLKPNATLTDIDAARAKDGAGRIEDIPAFSNEALRESVLLDKLQTYQNNKVVVTEQDARDSFQQWHTAHVLIGNKKRSDVQAQSQAQQILAKAQAPGADFAGLAKQYSEDPGTKDKGGDDGWIDRNTPYVPEFKTAAFALKANAVTLVKSPQYGYFVIKLLGVRSNVPKDFDKNTAQYIAQVKQQKQQQAQQDFLAGLKNDPQNKIAVSDPELRADRTQTAALKETDTAKQQAGYQSALADYQKALASKPATLQAAEINAQLGQCYQALHQTPQAINAFTASVTAADDPALRMQLGDLYRQNKQPDQAIAQYQSASTQAWDNQQLHQQLMMDYLQLKRPDLVAQEQKWLKDYQARQAQMMPDMPPGATVAPPPPAPAGSGKPATPQAVQVVPASGQPSAPGTKLAQ